MFKKTIKSVENELGYGSGYVITDNELNHLSGRLLTLIETLGLKDKQEKSIKDLVRQEVRNNINRYINRKLITSIILLNDNINDEERKRSIIESGNSDNRRPIGEINGDYELTFIEKEE